MTSPFWAEFGTLFIAALVGAAAVMPYVLKLLQKNFRERTSKFSIPALIALSYLQTVVVSAIAIGIGLPAAHAIGLGAPYIEAFLVGTSVPGVGAMLLVAALSGAGAGAVLLCADFLFLPYWPQALVEASRRTTVMDNFLASFYGGINEELLMRLFGLSVLVWLAGLFNHATAPSSLVFWSANIVMTVVFGLGHLPALKQLLGNLPNLMVLRSLLLNAPVGLLCGWLFWTYGIEAAMVAHFCADIIYHVIGTEVLNRMPVRRATN